MGLTRDESLAKYGTESYTAWDEPGAQADWNSKNPGLNVLQKQPNPAQVQPFQPIKGFSESQNKYAEATYNTPDYQGLYNQYSQETGLGDVKKTILDIDNTVADIEDKIAKVEPNINKEIGDYLITEGQRGRMVSAGEQPLRTQYADILRSRSRLSAEASSKAELVNTMLSFAQSSYTNKTDYLKTIMDIESANKTAQASIGNPSKYLPDRVVLPDSSTPIDYDSMADDLLKGIATIDDSGDIGVKSSSSSQFDKYGNLIIGGGMKLNQTPKSKPFSLSTKFKNYTSGLA